MSEEKNQQSVTATVAAPASATEAKDAEPTWLPMKGKVITTVTQCLRASWPESSCSRCLDICPVDAISYDKRIIIKSKACIDCGLCANACPTDGILASMTPPETLYNRIVGRIEDEEAQVFYLTCSQTDVDRASGCVLTVPCLGDLSPEIWYALVRDYDVRAYLPDGLCLDCPATTGADLMFDCVDAAQQWLGFDIPLEGSWHTLSIPENGYVEETDVFANLVQRIGEASKGHDTIAIRQEMARQERLKNLGTALVSEDALENRKPLAERGKRRVATGRRRLILNVLGHHPEYADEISVQVSKTTSACVGCKECVEACPVGARIAETTESGTAAITTDPRHCVGCGQCIAFCPHDAIEWSVATGHDLTKGLSDFAKAAEAQREEQRRLREQRRIDADRRRNEAIERAKAEREQPPEDLAAQRATPTETQTVAPPAYEAGTPPTPEPIGGDE